MNTVHIKVPIWKDRSVGIAEHKIGDGCLVRIDYTDRAGNKLYPHPFLLTREKGLSCPVQMVKGIKLRIVKIDEMQQVNEYLG